MRGGAETVGILATKERKDRKKGDRVVGGCGWWEGGRLGGPTLTPEPTPTRRSYREGAGSREQGDVLLRLVDLGFHTTDNPFLTMEA